MLLQYPVVKLVAAVVLAVTFLRVSLRNYYLAVAFVVFFLPLQEVVGTTSFLLPGLNLQTMLILFLVGLAMTAPAPTREPRPRNAATAPLVLLFIVLLFSAFRSATGGAVPLWNHLTHLKNSFIYCALMWLCFAKVWRRRDKLIVVLFVFLAVLFNVAVSLRNVFQTLSSALMFLRHRATSLISDQPNLYGGFLALYLFFFIGFLLYYPMTKRQRTILSICTGLVALNLLYTLSRGAWLAAVLTTIIVVVAKSPRMLIPVAIFSVVLALAAPNVVVDRWQSTIDSDKYSVSHLTSENADIDEAASRIIQWRTFLPMFMLSPVFGIGKGNYAATHFRLGYDVEERSPHSSVIKLGVEEGILGLICYLSLMVVVYRSSSLRFRAARNPLDKALAFGTLSATLCLFFLDLTGMRFFTGSIMGYYWILTGITLNTPTSSLRENGSSDIDIEDGARQAE
jgi:O-antigen ligase